MSELEDLDRTAKLPDYDLREVCERAVLKNGRVKAQKSRAGARTPAWRARRLLDEIEDLLENPPE